MALYIGAEVRALSGTAPLIVTSTVRDDAYQRCSSPQPRGDAQLLAAHDRLGVRHRAPLRLEAPGAGVPVRARPPAGARRDRLGARARRDPHHRLAGGEGAAPAARAGRTRAHDRRHPHARRAARGPARTSRGSRATARSTGCGSRTSTRATARPVVMWHGEPTWGFLWRKVAPAGARGRPPRDPARPAGLRPLGQADGRATGTPTTATSAVGAHAAGGPRHPRRDVRGARLGRPDRPAAGRRARRPRGPAGGDGHRAVHRPAADERRVARASRTSSTRAEDLPIGMLVRRGCHTDPGDEVAAAYDAPFPNEARKAGARAFPAILPHAPDAPGAEAGPARAGRAARGPPADADAVGRRGPGAAAARGRGVRERARRPAPRVIEGAGHFLQEDQGELIGARSPTGWSRRRSRSSACRLGGGRARRRARLVGRAGAVGALRAAVGRPRARRPLARAPRQHAGERDQRAVERGTKTSKRGSLSAETIASRRPPARGLTPGRR